MGNCQAVDADGLPTAGTPIGDLELSDGLEGTTRNGSKHGEESVEEKEGERLEVGAFDSGGENLPPSPRIGPPPIKLEEKFWGILTIEPEEHPKMNEMEARTSALQENLKKQVQQQVESTAELEVLKTQHSRYSKRVEDLQSENEELQSTIEKMSKESRKLNKSHTEFFNTNEELNFQMIRLKRQIEDRDSQIDHLNNQIQRASDKRKFDLEEMESQLEVLKKKNAELNTSLIDGEESQQKLLAKILEIESTHENEIAELKSKHKEKVNQLKENLEEMEHEKDRESRKMNREIENLRAEFEENEKFRTELTSQVSLHRLKSEENLLSLETKSEKVKTLRKQLEEMGEKADGLSQEKIKLTRENEALTKEVCSLGEKLDEMEDEKSETVKSLRQELGAMEEQKDGLLKEKMKLSKQNEALTKELSSLEERLGEIEALKSEKVKSLRGMEEKKDDLSREKIKLSKENEALAKEVSLLGEKIEEVEAQLATFEKAKTKLSRENAVLREGMDESEKARNKLTEEVQDLKNQKEAEHSHVLQLKKNLVESVAESEAKALIIQAELKQASADLQAQNEELRKRLSKVQQQYDQSMTHNEELQMTSREAALIDGKMKQRIEELEKQLEGKIATEDLEVVQKELKINSEENKQLQATNEQLILELEELKALKAKFEQTDMHQIYVENQTFQKQIEFGKEKLNEINSKLEEFTKSNQVLQEQVDGLRNQNEELREEKDEVEEDLLVLQKKYMNAVRLAMDQEMYIKVDDPKLNKQLGRRRSGLVMPSELTDITEDSVDMSVETMAMKTQLMRLTSENELEGKKGLEGEEMDDSDSSYVESDYENDNGRVSKSVTFHLPDEMATVDTDETFE